MLPPSTLSKPGLCRRRRSAWSRQNHGIDDDRPPGSTLRRSRALTCPRGMCTVSGGRMRGFRHPRRRNAARPARRREVSAGTASAPPVTLGASLLLRPYPFVVPREAEKHRAAWSGACVTVAFFGDVPEPVSCRIRRGRGHADDEDHATLGIRTPTQACANSAGRHGCCRNAGKCRARSVRGRRGGAVADCVWADSFDRGAACRLVGRPSEHRGPLHR